MVNSQEKRYCIVKPVTTYDQKKGLVITPKFKHDSEQLSGRLKTIFEIL